MMKIIYIGSGEIGVPTLEFLLNSKEDQLVGVVTQPDRPAGRQLKLSPSPIKQAALNRVAKIFQPEKINTADSVAQLRDLAPDLAVVCAYGQILKPELLALPRLGCINIHASLLPRHRGSSCIQAAIRQGDASTGVTVMWMDAGLDTGDVLLRKGLPISATDTAGTLHDKLAQLAPAALQQALQWIRQGRAPHLPQDNALSSYAGKLHKEDGQIDWRQEAVVIERHIRAMSPWPTAYTWLEDAEGKKMLRIFPAQVVPGVIGEPGQVLRIDDQGLLVAAGYDGLLLTEVQAESRKRMSAIEFARGARLAVGTVLGRP